MSRKILFLLLVTSLPLTSCGDALGPRDRGVFAKLDSDGLVVTNRTASGINYFTVERGMAARINWAAGCVNSKDLAISPNQTVTIPYSELYGWDAASKEALFYWWRCVPSIEGEYVPDEIHVNIAGQ